MRVFVGIDLPSPLRQLVWRHVEQARRSLPDARWVRPENYHFTLVFLGEVSPERIPEVEAALAPRFGGWRPFDLQLAAAGSFPPRRPARVLWIGLREGSELERLQESVASALAQVLDVKPERRPYHPHLTVARCSRPWPRRACQRWAESLTGPIGEPFPAARGTLFRSRLGPGGARYEVMQSFAFEEKA